MLTIESQPATPARPANGPRRVELVKPRFPKVVTIKGRHYNPRSELERYKAELVAEALGVAPVYPPPPAVDSLVPSKIGAEEMGVGRRTYGRRMKEAKDAAKAAAAALPTSDAA